MTSPTSTDAVALLRELEWCSWDNTGGPGLRWCPICRRHNYDGPVHAPDCRLAKAIAKQPAEAVEAEKDQLCALIFNNVEANVGYVACGPIAILGDVTDAATAILNAGFRKHALRTRIEAEDRAKSGGEAK